MRRGSAAIALTGVLAATLTVAVLAASAAARPAGSPFPAGWAPGGKATDPASQIAADTSCGSNSVLLFSARGSGDQYGAALGKNKIGAWTQGAGIELIHEGWNVRDLQAIYPAPPVPSFGKLAKAAAAGALVRSAAGATAAIALVAKQFRDVVSGSWQSDKQELEAAYNRCPNRKILLAGYSQGAILLRYIIPRLDPAILKQVVSVDLFADPTEEKAVDSGMQHPGNLGGRLTTAGVDTFSGELLNGPGFRQTAYPASVQPKTYQYCVAGDLVCDFAGNSLLISNVANEGKIHASYGFEVNGIAAGKRAGAAPGTPASWRLSPLGLGPIRFGMTLDQAEAASGLQIKVTPSVNDCGYWSVPGVPGSPLTGASLGSIVETGGAATIALPEKGYVSDTGIRAGDTLQKLRTTYLGKLHEVQTGNGGYAKLAKTIQAEYAVDETEGGRKYTLDFMVENGLVVEMQAGPWDILHDWTECA
jgi:hypothetical protein